MKHILLTITLLLYSLFSIGQLTIQTNPNYTSYYGGPFSITPNLGFFTADVGTNVYARYDFISGVGLHIYSYILRQNNQWKIVDNINGGNPYINVINTKFIANTPSNDINPPCNDVWTRDSGTENSLVNTTGIPPSIPDPTIQVQLTATGTTCNLLPTPVMAMVLTPTSMNLPQLTTSLINTVQSPQTGSMVWSIDEACVKVYNGTQWICL